MEPAIAQHGEDAGEPTRPAERMALEYLAACEPDRRPPLEPYLARLGSAEERAELTRLVAASLRAAGTFPQRVEAGKVLAGRYQLIEEIGAGGMGRVWTALDRELSRQVAVKVLDSGAAAWSVLSREREALARLEHPGIVAIHDARSTDSGLCFLVMDRIEGVTLAEALERLRAGSGEPSAGELEAVLGVPQPGRPSLLESGSYPRSAARIVVEILKALESAHAKGVVHRDLKPSNVLLRPGGHPALLDFGLASLRGGGRGDGGVTGRLYGSPGYLAPEQLESGRTGDDPRTDVYQAGLLLYALLARRDAFPRDAEETTLDRIRRGEIAPPPGAPSELAAIVGKATARRLEDRYAGVRAFREDLERYLGGKRLPSACADARWPLRLRYLVRRRALPFAAAGGGLALALAVWLARNAPPTVTLANSASLTITTDASASVVVLLGLERDGRLVAVVPLRPAAGGSSDPRQRSFALAPGVDPAVLAGGLGTPVLWCFVADIAAKLAFLQQSVADLERLVLTEPRPRGAFLAEWSDLLEQRAREGRHGGEPVEPSPVGFGVPEILGDHAVGVRGVGLVRLPLRR